MALYVVIAPGKGEEFEPLMARLFPDNHYRVGEDAWIVSQKEITTRQLSEKLEITNKKAKGPYGPAVVLDLKGSYWGRYNTSLWEWMKLKLEEANA